MTYPFSSFRQHVRETSLRTVSILSGYTLLHTALVNRRIYKMKIISSCCIFVLFAHAVAILNRARWATANRALQESRRRTKVSRIPLIFGSKQLVPSNTRMVKLFARTGRFLQMTRTGKLKGAITARPTGSKYTQLLVEANFA